MQPCMIHYATTSKYAVTRMASGLAAKSGPARSAGPSSRIDDCCLRSYPSPQCHRSRVPAAATVAVSQEGAYLTFDPEINSSHLRR